MKAQRLLMPTHDRDSALPRILDLLIRQAEQMSQAADHAAAAQKAGMAAWAQAFPIPEHGFTEEVAGHRRDVARALGLDDVSKASAGVEWARNAAFAALASYEPANGAELDRKRAALAAAPDLLSHHVRLMIERDVVRIATRKAALHA